MAELTFMMVAQVQGLLLKIGLMYITGILLKSTQKC
jgi:hypothetical protein